MCFDSYFTQDDDDEDEDEFLEFNLVNNLDALLTQMEEAEVDFKNRDSPYLAQRPYEILANIE